MRALGIDFGTKIIGIAISDENKKIASACASITFPKNNYLYAVNQIQKLIKRYDNSVDLIVLGYPLHINGNKSERTFLVEKFYDLLMLEDVEELRNSKKEYSCSFYYQFVMYAYLAMEYGDASEEAIFLDNIAFLKKQIFIWVLNREKLAHTVF